MMSKGLLVFGAAAGLAAAGVEGLARFQLGLGDPPLTIIDETIEYRFAPGHYRRFGNTVSYNAYSMRSDALPDAATHRVLVAGDSVVNGGAQTDQTETITGQLSARLGPSVFVPTSRLTSSVTDGSTRNAWFSCSAPTICTIFRGPARTTARTFPRAHRLLLHSSS
jgi:hypothetical protein